MRIAIAQLNPTVGDFEGNLGKIEETLALVRSERPNLVAFPEMFLTGYPPQDLLEKEWFIDRAEEALAGLARLSGRHAETGILTGTVSRSERTPGKGLFNSAVLLKAGATLLRQHKMLLPTYDVFDEARYFDRADGVELVEFAGEHLGVSICEDAWTDPGLWRRPVYDVNPVADAAALGATLLINLSASPFSVGKDELRYRLFSDHARKHGVPFVLVNQVGGNDELVFDGHSMLVAADGALIELLPGFEEGVRIVDTGSGAAIEFVADNTVAAVHDALVLGLRDYVAKCGFESVAVGLSGGIDSAVVCALAARALGPENVVGVTMPSAYSSAGSVNDSVALATNLGVRIETVHIADVHNAYLDTLRRIFPVGEVDVTVENVQARIRGNILMALSNREGHLVLSTGNKSELAVGYCTLYGDMSGGLAVISDVPKTMVYELARYVNRERELIPNATIEKPPSAELRPDQRDQDTLPPYETLDRILAMYVDHSMSPADIIAEGLDSETVRWVISAVNGNEYKRRQAAPGLKVTSKAFGSGRRMPIAARFEP
ncbi:MAG: NAD+ synthase [Candidatus Eisenbacteria bacterium]